VETEDVLADQVSDVRPVPLGQVLALLGVRERAQVVDQRVDPDVHDLVGVPRDRDAPRLSGTAQAEVLQPARDEAPRLVVPEPRQHEVGSLVVEPEQLVLVGREAEEPVSLLDPLGHGAVVGTLAVHELRLGLEGLAAHAVETGVDVLVDVPVVVDPLDEVLDEADVPLVGRADEEVDVSADSWRQLPPHLGDAVDVLLRLDALLHRDAVHARRMLVGPREEERVLAALATVSDQDVGRDRRVRVPDVRRRVHVVDRCRQIEGAHRVQ
jgi:hypothetical protein